MATKTIKCDYCDGTGIDIVEVACGDCKGAGCHHCKFDGSCERGFECPKCEGLGELDEEEVGRCQKI